MYSNTLRFFSRYVLYIIPVAALLAIPLALTATIFRDTNIKGYPLLGLFVWIECIWVLLWVSKLLSQAAPIVFQAICGVVSGGIRKYTTVLIALEIPLSLFIWTIAAYGCSHLVTIFEPTRPVHFHVPEDERWPHYLRRVFLAGIVVSAIFLAEKTLVHLISIDYHRKQYDAKIKESKKIIWLLDLLYDASRQLFPEYCREFQEEDEEIQGNNLQEVRKTMVKAGMGTKVLNDMGRVCQDYILRVLQPFADFSLKTRPETKSRPRLVPWSPISPERRSSIAPQRTLSWSKRSKANVLRKLSLVGCGYLSLEKEEKSSTSKISLKSLDRTAQSKPRKSLRRWTAMAMATSPWTR